MASITLGGNAINTLGNLPEKGTSAPDFLLVKNDLSESRLSDYKNTRVVLNIFPSVDTGTCAASVRKFNQLVNDLENTKVLCISKDLPFAQKRFCGSEGLDNVINLSDFREGSFGTNYGLTIIDGPLKGLHSRAIVVIDQSGKIVHTEQVSEIADEPDYQAVIDALN